MATRKFKVVKEWVGCTKHYVGHEFEACRDSELHKFGEPNNPDGRVSVGFLLDNGFVEEVKEPEEFWFIGYGGEICVSYDASSNGSFVAKEFRFRTKESAEKFRDGLKDGGNGVIAYAGYFLGLAENDYKLIFTGKDAKLVKEIVESLNNRVTKE